MWSRTVVTALLLFVGSLTIFVHTLLDPDGFPRRARMRSELATLIHRNDAMRIKVERLRTQVKAHRERPEVIARAIRDELSFVKPGDIVIDFREE